MMLFRACLIVLIVLLAAACGRPVRSFMIEPTNAGLRPDTFVGLDTALHRAVEDRLVPGAVLSVARNGQIIYERAVGVRDLDTGRPVELTTLFDAASLTKPVATAAGAALLVCDELLSPQASVGPSTLDALLRHTSGIAEYAPWERVHERRAGRRPAAAIADLIAESGTLPAPGAIHRYSNLGYLLLSDAIEQETGRPLDEFVRERLWEPIGTTGFAFAPVEDRKAGVTVARSSVDREAGIPFDPLADYMRRLSPQSRPGHSGLFANAESLSFFSQALLNPGLVTRTVPAMPCIAEFLLGGVQYLPEGSPNGPRVGRSRAFQVDPAVPDGAALYHTGYTGTLMWLDRGSGISVVLLTNATHGGGTAGGDALRAEVLDIIRKSNTLPRRPLGPQRLILNGKDLQP